MNTPISQKPMRTIWHSLLWKEWHEHKWKLLMLTVSTLALLLLFFFLFRDDPQPLLLPVMVGTVLYCYSILVGMFLGMSTAGSENARGTMPFLRALPVSMQKPAATKLLMALLTVNFPVLVIMGAAYVCLHSLQLDQAALAEVMAWNPHGEGTPFGDWGLQQSWFVTLGLGGVLLVTSLLLWVSAAGVNRSDEIRAGAVGFLVIAAVWFGLAFLGYRAEKSRLMDLEYGVRVAMATAPMGPAFVSRHVGTLESYLPYLAAAVIGHGCVLAWYLRRFGHQTLRPARTAGGLAKIDPAAWLASPRRSQLSAIAWKQFWETGPLAILAAGAVLALSCLYFLVDSERPIDDTYGEVLAGITILVGFLVTLVTGMGVFLEDLKPKIGTFWRSRPVNYSLWFGVKFATGLVVLIVTFGSLALLAFFTDNNSRSLLSSEELASIAAYGALIFLLVYTLAMAVYCLIRQPIFAALATIGLLLGGLFALQYLDHVILAGVDLQGAVVWGMLLAIQVALTTLAWLAVRNNWGWHK